MGKRIIVEKTVDERTRETWIFNTFDLDAVFVYYGREIKAKGRRKWVVDKSWDKYGRDQPTQPILPEIIRSKALSQMISQLRILTWEEWKG